MRQLWIGASACLFGLGLGGCGEEAGGAGGAPAPEVPAPVAAPAPAVSQAGIAPGGVAQPGAAGVAAPAPAAMPAPVAMPPSPTEEMPAGAPAPEPAQEPEPADEGWEELVFGEWSLPAGTESYVCVYLTLSEPLAFTSLKPLSPPGTHHTLLSYTDTAERSDGTVPCDAAENGDNMLSASGVGTEATKPLPEGVSYQLPAGAQLLLNLHLYNVSDAVLTGRTGILIQRSDTPETDVRAEHILAGPIMLDIPPGTVVQEGRCTFTGEATIVEIFPHMHQTGSHLRLVATSAESGERVLYDDAYDFEYQLFYAIEPITLRQGDYVTVTCTYENTTDRTISFGDSSNAEMCFAGLVRYPALGGPLRGAGGTLGLLCTF